MNGIRRRLSAFSNGTARGPSWSAQASRETVWPITLHSMRFLTETRSTYRFHNRKREGFRAPLLQWTLGGAGVLHHQGETHPLTAGALMVLNLPGDAEYTIAPKAGRWTFLYLHIDGEWAQPWVRRFTGQFGPVCHPRPDGSFSRQVLALHEAMAAGAPHPARVSAHVWSLLMSLEEEMGVASGSDVAPGNKPIWLARVEARMAAMDDRRHLDLDALAGIAGFSKYHFLRRYREARGMTPMAALRQIRAREAARLLASTQASTRAVAEAVGWEDPAAMARSLRKVSGRGVRMWRESELGKGLEPDSSK